MLPTPAPARAELTRGGNKVTKELAERVYSHASKGQLTVTLGGDHSLVSVFCIRAENAS